MKELPSEYQHFIHLSRYARWRDKLGRRETWEETVNRYISYFQDKYPVLPASLWESLRTGILDLDVMPSMRCLMTAGTALDRDNVAGYNCSFLAFEKPKRFDEMMYILMCGTGVGFSVERQFINKLPEVASEFEETSTTIVVSDSKQGWAKAYRELISLLYAGQIPKWDMSRVRPAGARLKTFGGRASGPGPLDDLFNFTIETFTNAQGRKLNSIEVHDLACKIADIVVVGGVRRSALISLSNLTDERMRRAKNGTWWDDNSQRGLANNSVCYTERPDIEIFLREWMSLIESKSGERGIFNREGAKKKVTSIGRRDPEFEFGTNPCSEIILRPNQFCNLSEVIVRPDDTLDDLKRKVRLATFLGTLQSTLIDFKYLSPEWKRNTEEEHLLGVSLTGIMDHPVLNNNLGTPAWFSKKDMWLPEILHELKEVAIESNKEMAAKLGIEESTSITCVKPSGTVSQLVDSSSGIHPRYSRHYIRTVRADLKDPLCKMMQDLGFPWEPDVTKPTTTAVFSFPIEAPAASVFRDDRTAIEQLELWKIYQDHWCEHKPSITVYVKNDEWLDVGAWVYRHFDDVSGVSFLPHTDHSYRQAPYQEITEEEYNELINNMPKEVDWSKLSEYEHEDMTENTKELACTAGACEIL